VDVGHSIELYAEFSQTGGTYVPFPDAKSHRIKLDQLTDAALRERLRLVWTDPLSLDPARRSARVTREIAAKLAELAKSLEAAGHHADDVAQFLMRCLFTMFAEDVELLPRDSFRDLLRSIHDLKHFAPLAEELWRTMNRGGFSVQLRTSLLHFNGRLFADPSALALTRDQLDLLIEAAGADWQDVEPAIFGTLLERALDPVERHKLGAHYTPRAYVERLVIPAVIQPLRDEWDAVRAAAVTHAREGDRKAAVAELEAFHDRLCDIRVLDPACGSGNFLYVTLEHLKRLEGEVFATWESIAQRQARLEGGHTVDPHQLLGIEINPRAAAIAELVLWIGYLQWHFRTHGRVNPPEPVIKNFKNIQCRDAVLDWSSKQPELDEHGKPVTRWDGRTTKPHPVTGEEVPDETARVLSFRYLNPKKPNGPKRISSWETRRLSERAECGKPWVTATRRRCGRRMTNCPSRATTSCTGGTRRPSWCAAAPYGNSASSRPTACDRPLTAASFSPIWKRKTRSRSSSPFPITPGSIRRWAPRFGFR
jgi:hypothetical protein